MGFLFKINSYAVTPERARELLELFSYSDNPCGKEKPNYAPMSEAERVALWAMCDDGRWCMHHALTACKAKEAKT